MSKVSKEKDYQKFFSKKFKFTSAICVKFDRHVSLITKSSIIPYCSGLVRAGQIKLDKSKSIQIVRALASDELPRKKKSQKLNFNSGALSLYQAQKKYSKNKKLDFIILSQEMKCYV